MDDATSSADPPMNPGWTKRLSFKALSVTRTNSFVWARRRPPPDIELGVVEMAGL